MYQVVKKKDTSFRQISDNKNALNYITKDISRNFSLAITEGKNYLGEKKNLNTTGSILF